MRLTTLLKNARFVLAGVSSGFVYFLYTFLEPILASRLLQFELSTIQIGLFFGVEPMFYILASILIQFMPKYIEKRLIIITATVVSFIGFMLVGPS